jgi:hypothetical protein
MEGAQPLGYQTELRMRNSKCEVKEEIESAA